MISFFNLTPSEHYLNSWSNLVIESFSIEHYNKKDNQNIVLNSGNNKVKIRFKIYCGFGAVGKRKIIKSILFANTEYICNCSPSSTSTRWVYGDVEFNIKIDSSSYGTVGPLFKDGTDTTVASANWTDFSGNLYLHGEQYIERVVTNFSLDDVGHNFQGYIEVTPPRKISDFLLKIVKNDTEYNYNLNTTTNNNTVYNVNFNEINNSNLFSWSNMQLYYKALNATKYKTANNNINLNQRLRLLSDYNIIFSGKARYSSSPPSEWSITNDLIMNNSSFDILNQDFGQNNYEFYDCEIIDMPIPVEEGETPQMQKACRFNVSDIPKLLIKNINNKNYEFSLLPLMDWTSYFPPLYYRGRNSYYKIYENFQLDLTDQNNPKLILSQNGNFPIIDINNCSNPNEVELTLIICSTYFATDSIQNLYYEIKYNMTEQAFLLPKLPDDKVYKIYFKAVDEEQETILIGYSFCEYYLNIPECKLEKELTTFDKSTGKLTFFIKKDGNLRYKDIDTYSIKNIYTGDLSDSLPNIGNYKNKYFLQVQYNDNSTQEFSFNSNYFVDENFYSVVLTVPANKKIDSCNFGYYFYENNQWQFVSIQEIYSEEEIPTIVYLPNQLGINCIPENTDIIRIEKLFENNSPYKITIGPEITINIDAQTLVDLLNSANLTFSGSTWSTSSSS